MIKLLKPEIECDNIFSIEYGQWKFAGKWKLPAEGVILSGVRCTDEDSKQMAFWRIPFWVPKVQGANKR